MDIYSKTQRWKQILLLAAILIGFGSLWYTSRLAKEIEATERQKAELWAEAIRILNVADFETDLAFTFYVIERNTHIPVILTDSEGKILSQKNFDPDREHDQEYMQRQLEFAKAENDSLVIDLGNDEHQYIFYRDSVLLRKLIFFPYVQLAVIILFIVVSYIAFSVSKKAEQNEVWTGMSKETAHQLGTPISSLMGWMEILKESRLDPEMVREIEKDASRLEKITDRFSKIGSKPSVAEVDINRILSGSLDYIKRRGPDSIQYILDIPSHPVTAMVNETLFEWVIENLCKNAIDAIEGNGRIILHAVETGNQVIIDVEDSGKGIQKSKFRTVFKPGYTTKKRGWGLGLSLSKRIIESYHNGRIFVFSSEPGKSTVLRILLRKRRPEKTR